MALQIMKMIKFLNSLVARVLPEKYYILSLLLRAAAVDSPFYVWISLSAARPLLLLGIRQKIHSGCDVKEVGLVISV